MRRGSHLHANVHTGAIVDVPTRAGDVVAWSLRTTHSGHAVRMRGAKFLRLQPRFEARLPRPLRVPEPCERNAIFITYGIDDEHLRNYVEKHANLESYPDNYMFKWWLYSATGPQYDALARSAGIRLVRPIANYGSLFGSTVPSPQGCVPVGPAKPDQYDATGVEAIIQAAGRVVRRIRA